MKQGKLTAAALVLLLGLVLGLRPEPQEQLLDPREAHPKIATAAKVVFLASGLNDSQLISFTATVAASGHPGLVLVDSPKNPAAIRQFLDGFEPAQVFVVGSPGAAQLPTRERLGRPTSAAINWKNGAGAALVRGLFDKVEHVVVCPASPKGQLLQAACLAGVLKAPLEVLEESEGTGEVDRVQARLVEWNPRYVTLVGTAAERVRATGVAARSTLDDEEAVAAAHVRALAEKEPVQTLVVANPADGERGGMSTLAPWIALQRRAPLLLTNAAGTNSAGVVQSALARKNVERAGNILFVANLRAIPMQHRPNPAAGKDLVIDMEPLTPANSEPFTFAAGRLFHEDRAIVALQLARARLLTQGPRRALIVSNPGGSLPLLETFSRHTVQEIKNGGYDVTALFNHDCNKDDVRRLLPTQDIFMWEGHYRTMVDDYELPKWTEPLRPSFVFIQSCLALNEAECQTLFQRGAFAVLGSANRNYSGSGGAFSLCFFDALLYDDQTLGGSLRQSKNFLLAYAMLKEKRLGEEAKLQGANLRSAWAFTLWGDPTVKLPHPPKSKDAMEGVRKEVRGNSIILSIPDETYDKVISNKYHAQLWPNARLAGLVSKDEDDMRKLVPLLFAEVTFPKAPDGKTPQLKSSLSERNYVFVWDARRRTGYLLVAPGSKERSEVKFTVRWE